MQPSKSPSEWGFRGVHPPGTHAYIDWYRSRTHSRPSQVGCARRAVRLAPGVGATGDGVFPSIGNRNGFDFAGTRGSTATRKVRGLRFAAWRTSWQHHRTGARIGFERPDHHLRAGRERAGCHALFEVVPQRGVSRNAGAVDGDEAGTLDSNVSAPRIPPLRARPGHDGGGDRDGRRWTHNRHQPGDQFGGNVAQGTSRARIGKPGGSVVFFADAATRLGAWERYVEETQQELRDSLRLDRRPAASAERVDRGISGSVETPLSALSFQLNLSE